jgi:hypothetical protein
MKVKTSKRIFQLNKRNACKTDIFSLCFHFEAKSFFETSAHYKIVNNSFASVTAVNKINLFNINDLYISHLMHCHGLKEAADDAMLVRMRDACHANRRLLQD